MAGAVENPKRKAGIKIAANYCKKEMTEAAFCAIFRGRNVQKTEAIEFDLALCSRRRIQTWRLEIAFLFGTGTRPRFASSPKVWAGDSFGVRTIYDFNRKMVLCLGR
jgi:hypothetical protein